MSKLATRGLATSHLQPVKCAAYFTGAYSPILHSSFTIRHSPLLQTVKCEASVAGPRSEFRILHSSFIIHPFLPLAPTGFFAIFNAW